MKRLSKIVLSAFMLMMIFSVISTVNVNATEQSDQIVEINDDSIQIQQQSNVRTTYLFREMTRLTICANIHMELKLNCEALRITEKDFVLEIEGEQNLQMTMTCTREEAQLGLMDGNTYRIRNRNTYRYQEGFCVTIECACGCQCLYECQCVCDCECQCQDECQCDCDCECQCQDECQCVCNCGDECCFTQARLRIRVTNQNRFGQWAYYSESSKEWVTVPTTIEDGYLTAQTDHFSTWTVLIPISSNLDNTVLIIGISAGVAFLGIIIGISGKPFNKKR